VSYIFASIQFFYYVDILIGYDLKTLVDVLTKLDSPR
jgi:hypothetical protein